MLAGAPALPGAFFMFGQLCAALCEADGVGAAVLAGAALTAVVPVVVDEVVDEVVDDVVDDGEEWLVVALATAMLPPNPTPSAPAPTAVPIMILPSLEFTVSASSRGRVMVLRHRTPALAAVELQRGSAGGMKSPVRPAGEAGVVSGRGGLR